MAYKLPQNLHNNKGYNCKGLLIAGQVDFAETENGNRNTESAAHACSQVPSCDAAIAHVFFGVYLPVSAPALSWIRLPRFPDQGRSFVTFVLLTRVFLFVQVRKNI